MKRGESRRGQVWIETVMYTLIAFAIMGLVLAYARPKIEELQDKAIIEQSILMLKDIDSTLMTMGGAGNQRVIEISIKKGDLKIDGENDNLIFEMTSGLEYSQIGQTISDGNVDILTTKSGNSNVITLTRDFVNDYNITNAKRDDMRTLSQSPVAYTLKISNRGTETSLSIYACTEANAQTDCAGKGSYTSSRFTWDCVNNFCEYTSKRPTMDFELS